MDRAQGNGHNVLRSHGFRQLWLVPRFIGVERATSHSLRAFVFVDRDNHVPQCFQPFPPLPMLLLCDGACRDGHRFGRRRYATRDESRNNPWLALLTLGEGWHNNHHANPGNWTTQEKWWEHQYSILHYYAVELTNKIKYTDPLHATFNIQDSKEYKNLIERLEKIPPNKK